VLLHELLLAQRKPALIIFELSAPLGCCHQ
jgi:hypothetical protein